MNKSVFFPLISAWNSALYSPERATSSVGAFLHDTAKDAATSTPKITFTFFIGTIIISFENGFAKFGANLLIIFKRSRIFPLFFSCFYFNAFSKAL